MNGDGDSPAVASTSSCSPSWTCASHSTLHHGCRNPACRRNINRCTSALMGLDSIADRSRPMSGACWSVAVTAIRPLPITSLATPSSRGHKHGNGAAEAIPRTSLRNCRWDPGSWLEHESSHWLPMAEGCSWHPQRWAWRHATPEVGCGTAPGTVSSTRLLPKTGVWSNLLLGGQKTCPRVRVLESSTRDSPWALLARVPVA